MSEFIDNRAKRIETLKEIIKQLHKGADPESVKRELAEIVRQTDSSEIAAMEQELMAEGMPVEEVQSMCDLHSEVLRDLLVENVVTDTLAGHPVETMKRENEALLELIKRIRKIVDDIKAKKDTDQVDGEIADLRERFNELMDVEKHYKRKENLVFSFLERHGVTGPSKVMWGKDDEVRELLKSLGEALEQPGASAGDWKLVAESVAVPVLDAVEEMVFKENEILFPMALQTLTAEEWGEIHTQSSEYGWCLVEPGADYKPPQQAQSAKQANIGKDEAIHFNTGALSEEQLKGMLRVLPVDVTFVDADDRVAFFSEGDSRIFSRSKAIIGRKVHHCHPPKSVDVVDRIISDFKSGRQNVAEFWIQSQGLFVHIRYFAVRNDEGEYIGTLEVTQNIAPLRELEGEQRLLSYDD